MHQSPDPKTEGIAVQLFRGHYTSLRYKNGNVRPDEAGRQLKVRAVLMGRVVRRGDDFAMSAELVDVD